MKTESSHKLKEKYTINTHNINMIINFNREVIFEGCKGVVEYTDNSIKLNTGKFLVAFNGRGLHIQCMNESNIVIVGFITSIEYIM